MTLGPAALHAPSQGLDPWDTCSRLLLRTAAHRCSLQLQLTSCSRLQVHSFECQLPAPPCFAEAGLGEEEYRALFIRAPAVMEASEGVEVLGRYMLTDSERASQARCARRMLALGSGARRPRQAAGDQRQTRAGVFTGHSVAAAAAAQGGLESVAVAVRSGRLLATAFHPELSDDLRW